MSNPIKAEWTSPDGQHRILLGDCLEILPTLDTSEVAAVLADPPYNVGIDYGTHNDNMSIEEYTALARQWFTECRRIAQAVLITGHARLPQFAVIEPWKWLLCWWKPAAMGRSPVGFCNWEPIAMWGRGGSDGVDVIRSCIIPKKELNGHPCPKPLGWATGQIELLPWAETVLDPFAGSCTVAVACSRTGRRSISIEIEERYFRIGIDRMERELKRHPLLEPVRHVQKSLL